MCGIAGLIHKGKSANVGAEMTAMLQALKHRGPDSTGYAVYGEGSEGDYIMRLKAAEAEDMHRGRGIYQVLDERIAQVDAILAEHGASTKEKDRVTDYALRYVLSHTGDTGKMAEHIEEVDGVEILSLGNGLELIKDLGDAADVAGLYGLNDFSGTHGIGHTRMATESDVDIKSAHPYWAFPYNDVSVVHNGQITNYWLMRREMERKGHRFMSNCDSELLAVYTAHNLANGVKLEDSLRHSIEEIDGVFTYLVATKDQLGMAKDTMAAKPLVLYESDDLIAMASEEVAIRAILPQEIDTYDPYDEEVRGMAGVTDAELKKLSQEERVRALGMTTEQLTGKSLYMEFDPDAEDRFTYPWAPEVDFNKRTEIDTDNLSTTEVNEKIRALMEEGYGTIVLQNPRGKHSIAVGILSKLNLIIEGSCGYFAVGLLDGPNVRINGRVGWSCGENMMSGTIVIEENAGSTFGAALRGGDLVCRGSVGSRTGIDQKGGTIIVGGDTGALSGFMMQRGRMVVCGNAGKNLGDSMYDGTIYVGGDIRSCGVDAVEAELTDLDKAWLTRKLTQFELMPDKGVEHFTKIVAGKQLWNYDNLEPNEKKLIL